MAHFRTGGKFLCDLSLTQSHRLVPRCFSESRASFRQAPLPLLRTVLPCDQRYAVIRIPFRAKSWITGFFRGDQELGVAQKHAKNNEKPEESWIANKNAMIAYLFNQKNSEKVSSANAHSRQNLSYNAASQPRVAAVKPQVLRSRSAEKTQPKTSKNSLQIKSKELKKNLSSEFKLPFRRLVNQTAKFSVSKPKSTISIKSAKPAPEISLAYPYKYAMSPRKMFAKLKDELTLKANAQKKKVEVVTRPRSGEKARQTQDMLTNDTAKGPLEVKGSRSRLRGTTTCQQRSYSNKSNSVKSTRQKPKMRIISSRIKVIPEPILKVPITLVPRLAKVEAPLIKPVRFEAPPPIAKPSLEYLSPIRTFFVGKREPEKPPIVIMPDQIIADLTPPPKVPLKSSKVELKGDKRNQVLITNKTNSLKTHKSLPLGVRATMKVNRVVVNDSKENSNKIITAAKKKTKQTFADEPIVQLMGRNVIPKPVSIEPATISRDTKLILSGLKPNYSEHIEVIQHRARNKTRAIALVDGTHVSSNMYLPRSRSQSPVRFSAMTNHGRQFSNSATTAKRPIIPKPAQIKPAVLSINDTYLTSQHKTNVKTQPKANRAYEQDSSIELKETRHYSKRTVDKKIPNLSLTHLHEQDAFEKKVPPHTSYEQDPSIELKEKRHYSKWTADKKTPNLSLSHLREQESFEKKLPPHPSYSEYVNVKTTPNIRKIDKVGNVPKRSLAEVKISSGKSKGNTELGAWYFNVSNRAAIVKERMNNAEEAEVLNADNKWFTAYQLPAKLRPRVVKMTRVAPAKPPPAAMTLETQVTLAVIDAAKKSLEHAENKDPLAVASPSKKVASKAPSLNQAAIENLKREIAAREKAQESEVTLAIIKTLASKSPRPEEGRPEEKYERDRMPLVDVKLSPSMTRIAASKYDQPPKGHPAVSTSSMSKVKEAQIQAAVNAEMWDKSEDIEGKWIKSKDAALVQNVTTDLSAKHFMKKATDYKPLRAPKPAPSNFRRRKQLKTKQPVIESVDVNATEKVQVISRVKRGPSGIQMASAKEHLELIEPAKYMELNNEVKICPGIEAPEEDCSWFWKKKSDKPKKEDAHSKREDPCSKDKKEDPCKDYLKIEPPCSKKTDIDATKPQDTKKEDPCKEMMKMENPCKKEKKGGSKKDEPKKDPCAKKDEPKKDPCAKKDEPKQDPCKKKDESKKHEDPPCLKKDPCADIKKPKWDPPSSKKEEQKQDPCANKGPCDKKEEPKQDPCKKKDEPKQDPCKKKDESKKQEDPPCVKKDPCANIKKPKWDPPSSKKEEPKQDPCANKGPCDKKEEPKQDPCKKKDEPKQDPCKKKDESKKKEDPPCVKKDPCANIKKPKWDPPSSKKEEPKQDPCAKKDPCDKKDEPKQDPCAKKDDPSSQKKDDPCKKKDPCAKMPEPPKKEESSQKKDDPCKKKDPCAKMPEPPKKEESSQKPCGTKDESSQKKDDPCKKKDPCAKMPEPPKKEESSQKPCGTKDELSQKKDDPCKKKDPCAKIPEPPKKDEPSQKPCATKEEPCKKIDPCAKPEESTKKIDPCAKKEEPKKIEPCVKKEEPKKIDPCGKKEEPKKTEKEAPKKESPCGDTSKPNDGIGSCKKMPFPPCKDDKSSDGDCKRGPKSRGIGPSCDKDNSSSSKDKPTECNKDPKTSCSSSSGVSYPSAASYPSFGIVSTAYNDTDFDDDFCDLRDRPNDSSIPHSSEKPQRTIKKFAAMKYPNYLKELMEFTPALKNFEVLYETKSGNEPPKSPRDSVSSSSHSLETVSHPTKTIKILNKPNHTQTRDFSAAPSLPEEREGVSFSSSENQCEVKLDVPNPLLSPRSFFEENYTGFMKYITSFIGRKGNAEEAASFEGMASGEPGPTQDGVTEEGSETTTQGDSDRYPIKAPLKEDGNALNHNERALSSGVIFTSSRSILRRP